MDQSKVASWYANDGTTTVKAVYIGIRVQTPSIKVVGSVENALDVLACKCLEPATSLGLSGNNETQPIQRKV